MVIDIRPRPNIRVQVTVYLNTHSKMKHILCGVVNHIAQVAEVALKVVMTSFKRQQKTKPEATAAVMAVMV